MSAAAKIRYSKVSNDFYRVTARLQQKMAGWDHLVFGLLASYRNERTGVAWPSVRSLAKQLDVAERQVTRALGRLSGFGLIVQTGKLHGKGSVEYLVLTGMPLPADVSVPDSVFKEPAGEGLVVPVTMQWRKILSGVTDLPPPTPDRFVTPDKPALTNLSPPTPDKLVPPHLTNLSALPLTDLSPKQTKRELRKDNNEPTKNRRKDVVALSQAIFSVNQDKEPVRQSKPRPKISQAVDDNLRVWLHHTIEEEEQEALLEMVSHLEPKKAQEVLEELHSCLEGYGKPVNNPVGYAVILIRAVAAGTFTLSAAKRARAKKQAAIRALEAASLQKKKEREEAAQSQKRAEETVRIMGMISEEKKAILKKEMIAEWESHSSTFLSLYKESGFTGKGFDALFNCFVREWYEKQGQFGTETNGVFPETKTAQVG